VRRGETRVFLVGAGPGDPGLITRRGLEILQSCDVVLYDRLVSQALLNEAPQRARKIFVGKSPGEPSMPQARIDALIVEHAREGKRVVRLKGGDPFVFGRGADEAQALVAAGITFEIVPGVSSATAVPAYAGIPVTHSGVSSSFTVLTAQESADRPESWSRWRELATGAQTLVLLMGVSGLRDTAARLMEAGRAPNEPAAVIQWGTTSEQRTIVGELAFIADLAEQSDIHPPAITVVGNVVRLRAAIEWFESRPLFARRVVVTRPRAQANKLGRLLEQEGAEVIYYPAIEIVDPPSWDEVDQAVGRLAGGHFEWVAFSSPNGVERFFDRIVALGHDARDIRARVAAVGAATAELLSEYGIRADLVPDRFTAEAMSEAIGWGEGPVLLPRPVGAPRKVSDVLEGQGWTCEEVPVYRTVKASDSPEAHRIRSGDFDVVTFASSSAVRNLVTALGPPSEFMEDGEKIVACIGPVTAHTALGLGFKVDVVPDKHTMDGLVSALIAHLAS
jgi:uroporphyrinogen III methyltransferase / synthase